MPADAFIKNAEGDGFPFPLFFAIDKSRQNIYYRKQGRYRKKPHLSRRLLTLW